MQIGIGISPTLNKKGPFEIIQFLVNGTWADSLTTGPLWVEDNSGVLVTGGEDTVAIPGARLATTVEDGAELGPELVVNGGFDSADDWTTDPGWSIANGVATADGTESDDILQGNRGDDTEDGKTYQVAFDAIGSTQGALLVYIGGAYTGSPISGNGAKTVTGVASDVNTIRFRINSGFDGAIDNVSVREVIPTWLPTDSEGTALYTSQQVRTNQGTETLYDDAAYKGMMVSPAFTNKVEARKVNPTDTSGLTLGGDAAAVLSVVDDSSELAAEGLDQICTSGMVYKLDNSGGSTIASVYFDGFSGNTNAHSFSTRLRLSTGTAKIRAEGTTSGDSVSSLVYVQTNLLNITPANNSTRLGVLVDPGSTVYFILPELIESPYLLDSPVVPLPADDALTSYTRAATVAEWNAAGRLREQNCAVWGRVVPGAGGQDEAAVVSTTINSLKHTTIRMNTGNTELVLQKTVEGGNNYTILPYTHAKDTPFEYQAAWTDKGMIIRVKEDGGAWSAWATNSNTDPAPIADTFQTGARNGANQFSATYPFTATAFLPAQASLADYQNWIETNEKWNVLGEVAA